MTLESRAGEALTASQREKFSRDGYLVLEHPCGPELPDAVVSDIESLYRDAFDPGPEVVQDGIVFSRHQGGPEQYHWHRIRNAWKISSSVRSMALAPKIVAAVRDLAGREVLPFQTLNFPMGTEQPPHQDAMHFSSDPAGYMCGAWVALEDMDMDNGPLVYYPGSHTLPFPTWSDVERVTDRRVEREDCEGEDDYRTQRSVLYADYCQRLIELHSLAPEYATIRKGQALIWAANLLHGGSPQADKTRTRHSQVTHYFFEGCRHFTPMAIEHDHVFWNYPEWIRDPLPDGSMEALENVVKTNVPAGSTMLVVSPGYEPLLRLPDRCALPFPQDEIGSQLPLSRVGEEAVEQLERLRASGAQYAVFPKAHLSWLEYQAPELQERLEADTRAIMRDGAYCAIYALG